MHCNQRANRPMRCGPAPDGPSGQAQTPAPAQLLVPDLFLVPVFMSWGLGWDSNLEPQMTLEGHSFCKHMNLSTFRFWLPHLLVAGQGILIPCPTPYFLGGECSPRKWAFGCFAVPRIRPSLGGFLTWNCMGSPGACGVEGARGIGGGGAFCMPQFLLCNVLLHAM